MTEADAQALIRMVESNWQMDLGTARGMWRTELLMYDAETVTKAVGMLARKVSYKIRLADVVETADMLIKKRNQDAREEANRRAEERGIKEGKRGYATPEWVWVWLWARNVRGPREHRSFPQQAEFTDPMNTMTTTQYDELLAEWKTAGSPKGKIPLVGTAA